MNRRLYRLCYFSENRIPGDADQVVAEIRQILSMSRHNNAAAGISGALMFNSGCFVQILEGALPNVEETFELIQRDERHGAITVVALEPIESRSFEHWSMAFVGASLDDAEKFSGIVDPSSFNPSQMSADHLHELLCRLALEQEDRSELR
ncbi:BLUF domain-containing protein [Consotaella salsifontis]|uniref:Sensors of blue-light using FAD n=1 Tax=Consotaella salsifontis TaxID=1365950 RepID=A0A1T4T3Q9_9HYPH|nr:BLUF domain-containing protein [Consotaella salsifontis]SKA34929.1 Sensors of blue-light using FAD [Consotaella salsifontis]